MSGWKRLGILLSIVWVVCAVGIAGYEYSVSNPFCQFDEPGTLDPICQHFFWQWVSDQKSGGVLEPNIFRIVGTIVGIPLIGWALGFGAAWVARGFKSAGAT